MSAAAEARPMLLALVKQAQTHTGSRMAAYERVAQSIGYSSVWIQKFLGRQLEKLDADLYLVLIARYELVLEEQRRQEANTTALLSAEWNRSADELRVLLAENANQGTGA